MIYLTVFTVSRRVGFISRLPQFLWSSHSPHHDGASLILHESVPDALLPRQLAVAVEYDEVPLVHAAHGVHVLGSLLQPLLYEGVQAILFTLDFQFQNDTLGWGVGELVTWLFRQRLADEQVGTFAPQSLLSVYIAATVHYPLQESL